MINRFFLITILAISTAGYVLAKQSEFFGATFISATDAKTKWGAKDFNPANFKNSSDIEKSAMATDAIQKNVFVNQKMSLVREKMGDPDSYFFSDTIYAYKITRQKSVKDEAWHLVFIPDKELEKVAEVKVHKKCCYPTPPWAR